MLDEQVDAVRHDLQGDDLPAVLVSLLPNQLPQPSRDSAAEDRAPVFRAPHHMQPQIVHTSGERAEWPGHGHSMSIPLP